MSADDTPPRVWWRGPNLIVARRYGACFDELEITATGADWIAELSTLPDGAVELHPAPAPPTLGGDPCGDTETACPHCGDCACTRCRRDAEIHAASYGPVAVAPETSDPTPAEVASRLSAAADAANRQGAYDVERALNTVELRMLRDDRLARAVAAALSGEGVERADELPDIAEHELSRTRYPAPDDLAHEGPRGVTLAHVPTGLTASCHTERSRLQNTVVAYRELRVAIARALSGEVTPDAHA